MADGAAVSLKSRVSEGEWSARVELAALYRLVALHGWDDMIFTHIWSIIS
ncbi:MAG: class II aldolase/adducin family protein [bacterium]|nr:MAG: class II aldolase/adducin family protein [bacterium]